MRGLIRRGTLVVVAVAWACGLAAPGPAAAQAATTCPSLTTATRAGTAVTITPTCSDALTLVTIARQPADGSITTLVGSITYTPKPGFTGTDSFAYEGTSLNGTSAPATVTVTVNPYCAPLSLTTPEGAPGQARADCTDALGQPFTSYDIAGAPAHGTASVDQGGLITYTPASGFAGTDSFTYDATTSDGTSEPQAVHVTVAGPPSVGMTGPLDGAGYYWASIPGATVTCAPGTAAVLASCAVSADGTSILDQAPAPGGSVSAGPLGLPDAIGRHTVTVTATDTDGQTASRTVTYTSSLALLPLVTAAVPRPGARYPLGRTVRARYGCAPAPGGPALRSCTGTARPGRPIDTRTLGRHAFAVTAADGLGQSVSVQIAYTVVPTTNRFAVARAAADRGGAIHLLLRLPGPGRIRVIASGWARSGGAPAAFARHFLYARRQVSSRRAGRRRLTIRPDPRGRALVRLAGVRRFVALQVAYTPTGGRRRIIRRRLRVP